MAQDPTLRVLARQPGWPALVTGGTVARLADEMFSVAVVLLVLERTGSAALAGATVAAVTLPSLVSGPYSAPTSTSPAAGAGCSCSTGW